MIIDYSKIDYKINVSAIDDIMSHLLDCDKDFQPKLSSYVNINEYSKKIFSNAMRFEAWYKHKLIGLVAVYFNNESNKKAYITNVSLNSEFYDNGIGKVLLKFAINHGWKKQFETIMLSVYKNNQRSIDLYYNLGFVLNSSNEKQHSLALSYKNYNTYPLVSVCCITYNHKEYIEKSIKSFLMQNTTFPFEIIIHDDASTDRTAEIVRENEKKHPNLITAIYQTENQYSKGKKISPTYVWPRAKGKYIALCEGDDYWTDEYKLQKQVDFLESNPDFVLCCHNTKLVYNNNQNKISCIRPDWSSQTNDVLTIEDQIRDVYSYHTSSVIYRNRLLEIPDFFIQIESGDIALFTMLAQFGKIKYLDEVMSVYRKHGKGITQFHSGKRLYQGRLNMNLHLDRYFEGKYTNLYKVINEDLYANLFETCIENKKLYSLIKHSLRYLIFKNSSPKSNYEKMLTIMKKFILLPVKLLRFLFVGVPKRLSRFILKLA